MTDAVEVRLPQGVVRGLRVGAGGVFRAVPYAAPPTGERRFLPPQPVDPWSGVRDATAIGPTAPQRGPSPAIGHLVPNVAIPGDDYLHVNVTTPDLTGSAPVAVFIHGGSFVTGSNAVGLYEGSSFARDGVVFVTVNYRLGVDGFLLLDDAEPNRGLLDQIAALRWVRETIARFGGDPERVTVMGESAGAMSIGTLLTMPSARGLFHRAILESGAAENVLSVDAAKAVRDALVGSLQVAPTRAGLAGVSTSDLIAAQERVPAEIQRRPSERRWRESLRHLLPFEPVVDGRTIPIAPQRAIAVGAASDVPVLLGYNTQEARLFFLGLRENGIPVRVATSVLARRYGLASRGIRSYRRARGDGSDLDVLVSIVTDAYYRFPAQRIAESAGTRYLYGFDWRSKAQGGRLGAGHTVELPFAFDALDHPDAAGVLAGERPQDLADRVHGAWVRFIRDGEPGWEPYGPDRIERRFGIEDETIRDAFAAARARWATG